MKSVASLASSTVVVLDETVTMESGQSYAVRFRRADGASLLRTVMTTPGETRALVLTGLGDLPSGPSDTSPSGDLAFFGVASRESFACTVKGVEAMENFTARLTLVDHAPQIEQLVDAEVPPLWSGRAGAEAQANTDAPLAPIVTGVASGREAASVATDANPYPVVVSLQPNPAGTVTIATYEVRSRIIGTTTWATTSADASSGAVLLPGYAKGNHVEFDGRGISPLGTPGERTTLMTHVVGSTDPVALSAPSDLQGSEADGIVSLTWLNSSDPRTRAAQVLTAAGGSALFAAATPAADAVAYGPSGPGAFSGNSGPAYGAHRWWIINLDDDRPPVTSMPAGPLTTFRTIGAGNALTAPMDATNAAWVKSALTATGVQAAPDGTTTATLLSEAASTGTHTILQDTAFTAGAAARGMMALKAAGRRYVLLRLTIPNEGSSGIQMIVDLQTGSIVSAASPYGTGATLLGSAMFDLGNGWWLPSIQGSFAGQGTLRLAAYVADDSQAFGYPGDPTKGVLFWTGSLGVN